MEDNNYSSENSDTGRRVLRGHWRPEEDEKLMQSVLTYGARNWNTIAESIEGRTGKSCRLRWFNQLNPLIKKGPFSREEEDRLIEAHNIYGNKWSAIASLFPGRTDNALKNHFHVVTARNRREEMKSSGHIGVSSYFQRPSASRFHNPLRNSSHFSGYGTPYPFQYTAAISTSWNESLWKAGNSSSFEFSRLMTEAIGPVEHGNYMFPPEGSTKSINSWMASGSSSIAPAPNNNHQSTGFLGMGIELTTPSVDNNHSLFMAVGSGNGKVRKGSCSLHRNSPPFIDFLGVGDKY